MMKLKCGQHGCLLHVLNIFLAITVGGCALNKEISKTPRTAIEQLLLTQALERALVELKVTLPEGESLLVEVTGLQPDRAQLHMTGRDSGVLDHPSWDLSYIRDVVGARLGRLGYRIRKQEGDATYLVRAVVQSFGTNQAGTFFGLPPIQSVVIPVSLPELAVFKEQEQEAYARILLDVFEAATGRFVRSSDVYIGQTYYTQYTLLFFITFFTTDLLAPP